MTTRSAPETGRRDRGDGDDTLYGGPGGDDLDGDAGWDFGEDPVPPNTCNDLEDGICVERAPAQP